MTDGLSGNTPLPPGQVLAVDIGGANLKAADGSGWSHSEAFPLWKQPDQLAAALARILAMRDAPRLVATMTGEIADCFRSRRHGVQAIVEAVMAAAGGREVGIYLVDGSIVTPAEAISRFREAAASNWHALARVAARIVAPAAGLLVDVGSTTTDIVPLIDGRPRPRGLDDVSRMACGELVYTGIERTPLAAIVRSLPWRGELRPVASERFADAQDVWLVLGALPAVADADTADGRPLDPPHARARIARMLLLDPDDFTSDDARVAAEFVAASQARQVAAALERAHGHHDDRPAVILLSGHGAPLALRSLQLLGWEQPQGDAASGRILSLVELLGPAVARVAPAHALACIAVGSVE